MKKTILIVLIFISLSTFAQTNIDMWYKLSPEITLRIEDSPLEFRWRPDDHIFIPSIPLNIARTDIMLGVNIWKFKLFNYSKFDNLGRYYTGPRIDFNYAFFNKKLLFHLQNRLFFGLNSASENHYYLIQYPRYCVTKNIHLGVLSYGKWEIGVPFDEGNWFIGPSAHFMLPYNFSLHLVLAKDIFSDEIYMTFIRLGYKIKIKRKKQIEE